MDIPSSKMPRPSRDTPGRLSTKQLGDEAERAALRYLEGHGLGLIERNYRTPGRGGGEIDLIMHDSDGTLVFVEVRSRSALGHGGAGASISRGKQRRIVYAARHYLLRFKTLPPCRFDVVLQEEEGLQWIKAAFDAG